MRASAVIGTRPTTTIASDGSDASLAPVGVCTRTVNAFAAAEKRSDSVALPDWVRL